MILPLLTHFLDSFGVTVRPIITAGHHLNHLSKKWGELHNKGSEPRLLAQYCAQPGATYDGQDFTVVKNAIRQALLAEQGYLCAYCLQRIAFDSQRNAVPSMKVEHWRGQAHYPQDALAYSNMLGCCMGNEGAPSNEQYCDSHKKDLNLSLNPSDRADHPRMKIRYAADGVIRSDNPVFDSELDSVLNLNWRRLRENRKEVSKAVEQALNSSPGRRTRAEIQRQLTTWCAPDGEGKLKEFCGTAIYFLEKRLKRAV